MGRHLVTSALPYINGVKHLGNLVGSMLPADVYARQLRQRGEDVLFICATDEHGTPAELAASAAGLPVAEFCAAQHEVQRDLGERFGLSFDHFGRTSSARNAELTRHFADALTANGFTEERVTDQIFSIDDDRFLPDRYVLGTCPVCGYDRARGDQCENCTSVLDPTDLIDPRSAISGSTNLEVRSTLHLFHLQSKLADEVRAWIDQQEDWPVLTTSIARKWLDEGLHDRSITRDLSWGVSVDRPGFEGKVFYVWFDAPIGYLGATAEWADADPTGTRDWRSWWWDAPDVAYTQFMAKDNVPFHTVSFPATIIGTREPWTRAAYIKSFNWLTYYGGKFSTTDQRGIFMDQALELLPADCWRWYLIANAPESSDSSFTWPAFAACVNSDLADTLGNFVNRVLSFTDRNHHGVVPADGAPGPAEAELAATLADLVGAYDRHLAATELRKAAAALRAVWAAGNAYWEQAAPWKQVKADPDAAAVTMRTGVNLVRLFATLAAPIIPATAATILEAVDDGRALGWPTDLATELTAIAGGASFTVPPILFRKLEQDEVETWEQRFGGAPAPA